LATNLKECEKARKLARNGLKAKYYAEGKPYGKVEFNKMLGKCNVRSGLNFKFWSESN
jgi:hypothetical protein